MKTLICFGTRPEAIKMAPVIHELRRQNLDFEVCVSGQHREMLDQVLEFFELVPTYDLELMQPDQSLNDFSSRLFKHFDEVLKKSKPDVVLVHGDTTTSTVIAMAAFYRNIPVAHVEAGLRTFDPHAPFPEEINRQLTARIAAYHFAPTPKARENLLKENIQEQKIFVTGNTIVDAVNNGRCRLNTLDANLLKREAGLENLNLNNFILLTGHRRENFGKGFENLCEAVKELVEEYRDLHIIFPVHLNPNVKKQIFNKLADVDRVHLIKPVTYPIMLWLIEKSLFIISDSGGIQEEAPAFGKKVLVTREFSERMEGVEAGFSILVGTNKERLIAEASLLLNEVQYDPNVKNPYGDGNAASKIVEILKRNFITKISK